METSERTLNLNLEKAERILRLTKNQNKIENHHGFLISQNRDFLYNGLTDVTLNLKFVHSTFFLIFHLQCAYHQYVLDLVYRSPELQSQLAPVLRIE